MQTVLVIDDEPGIRTAMKDILEDERYRVFTAEDGIFGLETLSVERVDLVFLDVWLPRMGGMDVLQEMKKRNPDLEVILISGHANIDLAVKAVKLGAFDFIEKPLSIDRVLTAARNALAIGALRRENRKLKTVTEADEELLGNSAAIQGVRQLIDQSAATDARILILGENGTGKELVAREIHRKSQRNDRPFIEVNCAAIPDTLIESELFGHEKGAFTDAIARRKGKFEQADLGTLFLDEIADMSLSAQAKVLRAIQELKFERVGGEESISVDVRIIAATNKNIHEEIKAGKFREDLFFRLNVIPITIAPLRERKEDIAAIAEHFFSKFSEEQGSEKKRLSSQAIEILSSYFWPGNIRELKNVIERISVMSDENEVSAETVKHFMSKRESTEKNEGPGNDEYENFKLVDAKDLFEKKFIIQKLRKSGYNITKTAEILGIYPSNLHAKMKKYGIQVEK